MWMCFWLKWTYPPSRTGRSILQEAQSAQRVVHRLDDTSVEFLLDRQAWLGELGNFEGCRAGRVQKFELQNF